MKSSALLRLSCTLRTHCEVIFQSQHCKLYPQLIAHVVTVVSIVWFAVGMVLDIVTRGDGLYSINKRMHRRAEEMLFVCSYSYCCSLVLVQKNRMLEPGGARDTDTSGYLYLVGAVKFTMLK